MIRLVRTVLGPCRRPDPIRINQGSEKNLGPSPPQDLNGANSGHSPRTKLNRGSSRDSPR